MSQIPIYAAVVALAVFNGVFAPQSMTVFALQGLWLPSFVSLPLSAMLVLSGIISGVLHLLVTGVPAAILEKSIPLNRVTSGLVWLAVMLVPTYQTLRHLGWV